MSKPIVLCILDGWGHSDDPRHNAIMGARTPHWNRLLKNNPHSLLGTSGRDVGLPDGVMGNSEVGHMNIGSGRVVLQDLPQINDAVEAGTLGDKPALQTLIQALKKSKGVCHLLGLISDGGVHAHIDHMISIAGTLGKAGIPVAIHAFTDGRDTAPTSAKKFIPYLQKATAGMKGVFVATVSGRYYAMDRDNRWERVQLAYDAMVKGKGVHAKTANDAVLQSHQKNTNDEFILPTVIGDYPGMKAGDAVFMANFRSDRARQILAALLDPAFTGFKRGAPVSFAAAVGMVEYSQQHNAWLSTMFPPQSLTHILGELIAERGKKQLRIAETEKYAHVTFFFNGGREEVFPGEDRILVPSPKVATYDQQPEMCAPEVTHRLVGAINSGIYDLIVVNYANTDMVGHTGIEAAAVKAVEAVDAALGEVEAAVIKAGGALLITADHGNAELMVDPDSHEPHTQHTLNPVPFVIVGKGNDFSLKDGRLCDIAPTILMLMGLKQPQEMSGISLIQPRTP